MPMNRFRFLFPMACFGSALLLVLLSRLPGRREGPVSPGVIPSNSIFHKPRAADCPPGTKLLPGAFIMEANGTTGDACQNYAGDGSIDYLNPGEQFVFAGISYGS